jgi:hypothetical protein
VTNPKTPSEIEGDEARSAKDSNFTAGKVININDRAKLRIESTHTIGTSPQVKTMNKRESLRS